MTARPLLFALIFLVGCGHKPAAESPDAPLPTVQTAPVRVGDIAETLPLTGTLALPRAATATVAPAVAGTLIFLPIHLGQTVTRGQIVARLSPQTLAGATVAAQAAVSQSEVQIAQAQGDVLAQEAAARTGILTAQSALNQARAAVAGARATLAGNEAAVLNARQNLTRMQTLLADGLVAQKDVEAAQLAVRTAQSQADAQRQVVDAQAQAAAGQQAALDAARAASLQTAAKRRDVQIARQQARSARGALETVASQRGQLILRAPLTGQVTAIGASVGEPVDATTKVVTLANRDVVQLQLSVPAERAARVQVGQSLQFTLDSLPGRSFAARIALVGPSVDAASGTVTAIARVADPNHRLPVGAFVSAKLTLARHAAALLVPAAAVLRDAGGAAHVVVVGADGVTHPREVQTGLTADGKTEIKSGISAGARVITVGGYGLPDGAKVQVAS